MARFQLALKALPAVYPKQQGGGTPTDLSRVGNPFTFVGGQPEIGGQTGTVATLGTTMVTDMTAISASLGTLISTIGVGTGSAQAQALLTLVNTGTTDAAALQTAANGASAAATQDVVISVNGSNVTRIQALKRAFDACINLAQGGYGGLTK